MQSTSLHVVMEQDVLTEYQQLGIGLVVIEHRTNVQSEFFQHILVNNAVAVQEVTEEILFLYGLQMFFHYGKSP